MTEPLLPDALSDLLDAAVDESEAIGNDSRYELYMFSWHLPETRSDGSQIRGVCLVCMAGALIARRLRASIEEPTFPDRFEDDIAAKLFAIDALRRGDLFELLAVRMPREEAKQVALRTATLQIRTHFDRELGRADWAVYRAAAAVLRGAGL